MHRSAGLIVAAALQQSIFSRLSLAAAAFVPASRPTPARALPRTRRELQAAAENKSVAMEEGACQQQLFGRFKISPSQIFFRTKHSFALVNLRPLVEGHVLVCSTRVTPLLSDLDPDEYIDLWMTVRSVQDALKRQYKCHSFNVAVQDGREAGQSVPHVHVHILPRHDGDFERNDDVYDELENWAPRDVPTTKKKLEVPEDDQRVDRTPDEMSAEASIYRSLMNNEAES